MLQGNQNLSTELINYALINLYKDEWKIYYLHNYKVKDGRHREGALSKAEMNNIKEVQRCRVF